MSIRPTNLATQIRTDVKKSRVMRLISQPQKPSEKRLLELMFRTPPEDQKDVDGILDYFPNTTFSNYPNAWKAYLMTRLFSGLLENPDNIACLEWSEALIKADLDNCSTGVLNGSEIKDCKLNRVGAGFDEHTRAHAIVSKLWGSAFRQFKLPAGGLEKGLEDHRVKMENNMVGLAMVGQWIGFTAEPKPRAYDIRRIARVHDAMNGELQALGVWGTTVKDDFMRLGAHLRHECLELSISRNTKHNTPAVALKPLRF